MGNKYNSNIRTFITPNLLEKTISPPNDLVIANGDWKTQLVDVGSIAFSRESNWAIRRMGLFCNFADGLVPHVANQRLALTVSALGVSSSHYSSTIGLTAGSTTITGIGTSFDLDFSAGDIVNVNGQYFAIDSVTDATNMEATNPSIFTVGGQDLFTLTPLIASPSVIINVSQLNMMYEAELFAYINTLSPSGPADLVIFQVDVRNYYGTVNDMVYLTKSISTDFDGDTALFDMHIELEYT